jgi:ABC-type transport system involved in cytochrome c biogenesis permease subunit
VSAFLDAANLLLPLGYLLAAIAYGLLFFAEHPLARRSATPMLLATVVLHLGYLVGVTLQWNQFPAVTVSQALSVVALAVALVYLVVEWHGRERSTGFWLVSMVFFFQLLSSLLRTPEPPDREIFHSALFASHVSLALLGYAAFVVAAGYGFLFLELYRELKVGRFSTFFGKLPPLEVLERMMTGALVIGFAALTGAVVLGILWAETIFPGRWLRDPKILFTFAVWALYALALLLRRLRRWHGRQTAMASLAGLGAILFSLLAVNLLFSDFHGLL